LVFRLIFHRDIDWHRPVTPVLKAPYGEYQHSYDRTNHCDYLRKSLEPKSYLRRFAVLASVKSGADQSR
jgi:hypothetical protein